MIVTAGFGAAAGTQNSYLAMGGYTPTGTDATEKYNGTRWTAANSMGTARRYFAGFGIQTAAVAAGGFITAGSAASEDEPVQLSNVQFSAKVLIFGM